MDNLGEKAEEERRKSEKGKDEGEGPRAAGRAEGRAEGGHTRFRKQDVGERQTGLGEPS